MTYIQKYFGKYRSAEKKLIKEYGQYVWYHLPQEERQRLIKEESYNKYKNIVICKNCNKQFKPKNHGGRYWFCSNSCSSKFQWKTRILKSKIIRERKCNQCGKLYQRNYGIKQWRNSKFCSLKCSGIFKRIKDGLNRSERYRRKNGSLKQGTPEWLEKIRTTTKLGMKNPLVIEKITRPKGNMSLENKIKISNSLKGRIPVNLSYNSGSYSNIKRGYYETSKGSIFFRSKWEANYALYLDFLVKQRNIKNWEYEEDVFIFEDIKLGTKSYRPDFKIFNNDNTIEYHEIKGYLDGRSKIKLRRMAKYYPEIELVLIDAVQYNIIKKQIGKILNFY